MAKKQESNASDPKDNKKANKAKDKADKKAAKKSKNANLTPYQRASRNMYWFLMTIAFGIVVWLCYEAYSIFIQNT